MKRCAYLLMKMDGIAESRPSVQKYDEIFAINEEDKREYQGYIMEVHERHIDVQFSDVFTKKHALLIYCL